MKYSNGTKIGNYTLIEFKGSGHWLCKCNCGFIGIRRISAIKYQKYCINCKPTPKKEQHWSWKGCGDISHEYYTQIKHSASAKNFELKISVEYLWELFLSQNKKCSFTGETLYFGSTSDSRDKTASLDRINSNIGYIEGNLQWVHKDVNKLKKNFSDERFIEICLKVAQFKKNKKHMEILEKIKRELALFEERRRVMADELRQQLPAIFAPLFEKSKLINTVAWTQYTSYFNDGDECTFSVYKDYLIVNEEYEAEFLNSRKDCFDANEYEIVNQFSEVLHSISEDFYRDLFGDHVKVVISRDGSIQVVEYEDHD